MVTKFMKENPMKDWQIWYDGELMDEVRARTEKLALQKYLESHPYVEGLEVYPG